MSYPIETYCDRCHTVHADRCAPEFPVNLPMTTNSKPELCEACGRNEPCQHKWHKDLTTPDKHKRVAERLFALKDVYEDPVGEIERILREEYPE